MTKQISLESKYKKLVKEFSKCITTNPKPLECNKFIDTPLINQYHHKHGSLLDKFYAVFYTNHFLHLFFSDSIVEKAQNYLTDSIKNNTNSTSYIYKAEPALVKDIIISAFLNTSSFKDFSQKEILKCADSIVENIQYLKISNILSKILEETSPYSTNKTNTHHNITIAEPIIESTQELPIELELYNGPTIKIEPSNNYTDIKIQDGDISLTCNLMEFSQLCQGVKLVGESFYCCNSEIASLSEFITLS